MIVTNNGSITPITLILIKKAQAKVKKIIFFIFGFSKNKSEK